MSHVVIVGGVFREILIDATQREVRLAGSGLYAAVSAARTGANVTLIAPIGSDDIPIADEICAGYRIATQWLSVGSESGTFVLDRAWWRSPRPQYKPVGSPNDEVRAVAETDILLVFGHPEWRPEESAAVSEMAASSRLIWDRQGWLSRTPDILAGLKLGRGDSVLLANLAELCEVLDLSPVEAENLAHVPDGAHAAIVKDGPWGVHVFEEGHPPHRISAYRVKPCSVLGSGDTFAGTLAAGLAQGDDLVRAGKQAALASATAMTSDDPLHPQQLAIADQRPVVLPSVRAGCTVEVQAADGWAARLLAGELEDLGATTEATDGGEPGLVRLTLTGTRCVQHDVQIPVVHTTDVIGVVAHAVVELIAAEAEHTYSA